MLTRIKVTIENDPHVGGIRIKSTANTSSLTGVSSIVIARKETSEYSWNDICTIKISSISDLNFEVFDYLAISGKTYSYVLLPGKAILILHLLTMRRIRWTRMNTSLLETIDTAVTIPAIGTMMILPWMSGQFQRI